MKKPGRRFRLALALMALAGVTACKNAEEKAFIADCQGKRGLSESTCSCVNDLINDQLEEKGQRYVRAIFLGDKQETARIQASFGLMEGPAILTRAGWLAANSKAACGVQM